MSNAFEKINALDLPAFTELFGALYEHSPWIAEKAWKHKPFADKTELLPAFQHVVASASPEQQIVLIREHPELARRVGVDESLTSASQNEQASAGLDRLTPAEHKQFTALNDAYRMKFSMPFIICVRLSEKNHILSEMERRTHNTPEQERTAALAEIDKIAAIRCNDLLKKLEADS